MPVEEVDVVTAGAAAGAGAEAGTGAAWVFAGAAGADCGSSPSSAVTAVFVEEDSEAGAASVLFELPEEDVPKIHCSNASVCSVAEPCGNLKPISAKRHIVKQNRRTRRLDDAHHACSVRSTLAPTSPLMLLSASQALAVCLR